MRRRDAETIRDLVAMLREERDKVSEFQDRMNGEVCLRKSLESDVDNFTRALDAAEARIADLEARPAAPSVEDMAEALTAYLYGPFNMPDVIAKICGADWDTAVAALEKAKERDDSLEGFGE